MSRRAAAWTPFNPLPTSFIAARFPRGASAHDFGSAVKHNFTLPPWKLCGERDLLYAVSLDDGRMGALA